MNKVDIIISIPLLWGAFMGFKKGFVLELASLVGLFLGIYGSLKLSDFTAEQLSAHVEIPSEWIGLISFLLTFVLIVFAVFLFAKVLDKALKLVALSLVNRILGLLFGLLKYALIVSVLLYFFTTLNHRFQMVEQDHLKSSILIKPLQLLTSPFSAIMDSFSLEELKNEVEELSS